MTLKRPALLAVAIRKPEALVPLADAAPKTLAPAAAAAALGREEIGTLAPAAAAETMLEAPAAAALKTPALLAVAAAPGKEEIGPAPPAVAAQLKERFAKTLQTPLGKTALESGEAPADAQMRKKKAVAIPARQIAKSLMGKA